VANSLTEKTIKWALAHLEAESDTDLFPRSFELTILAMHEREVVDTIKKLDLAQHTWEQPRRFLVLKDDFAFRAACQLDPFDALLFAALVRQIVPLIAARRGDKEKRRIFSYRTSPRATGALYGEDRYQSFWRASKQVSTSFKYVLLTDITDFYNQIYHHTVEQELGAANVPKDIFNALKSLMATCSATTSRGLPIGPHVSHLLAELSLRPLDDLLVQSGVKYHRYVDDFHLFFDTEEKAHSAYYEFARALDITKQLPNHSKTKIMPAAEFRALARKQLRGGAAGAESTLVKGIRAAAKGSYRRAKRTKLTPEIQQRLTPERVEPILQKHLRKKADFAQLRWLFRRLAQTGSPAAVNFVLTNFVKLLPAAGDVCRYLDAAAINVPEAEAAIIGDMVLGLLPNSAVAKNEYLLVTLLHLFANTDKLNHLDRLVSIFDNSQPAVQREIVLAAWRAGAGGWLRTLKTRTSADPWVRRAIFLGSAEWTDDERDHWTKSMKRGAESVDKFVLDTVRNASEYERFVRSEAAFRTHHI
jgi:hypothetical protein